MARTRASDSDAMSDDQYGVKARRNALRMTKATLLRLLEERGDKLDRSTLLAMERGEGVREDSLAKVRDALTHAEETDEETGATSPPLEAAPDPDAPVKIKVHLPGGTVIEVDTTVGAPPDAAADQLAAIAEKLGYKIPQNGP